jgi:hypothetical protein
MAVPRLLSAEQDVPSQQRKNDYVCLTGIFGIRWHGKDFSGYSDC